MPDPKKKKGRWVGFGKNRRYIAPPKTAEERALARIDAQNERARREARIVAANAARRADAWWDSPERAAQLRAEEIAAIEAGYAEVLDPALAPQRDAEYKEKHEATAARLNGEIQKALERGQEDVAMDLARELARDQFGMETDQIYAERFGNMPYHDNEYIRMGRGLNNLAFAQPDFDWQGAVDDKYYWLTEGNPADWRENENGTLKSGLNARLNEERMRLGTAGQEVRRGQTKAFRSNRINALAEANLQAVKGRLNQ